VSARRTQCSGVPLPSGVCACLACCCCCPMSSTLGLLFVGVHPAPLILLAYSLFLLFPSPSLLVLRAIRVGPEESGDRIRALGGIPPILRCCQEQDIESARFALRSLCNLSISGLLSSPWYSVMHTLGAAASSHTWNQEPLLLTRRAVSSPMLRVQCRIVQRSRRLAAWPTSVRYASRPTTLSCAAMRWQPLCTWRSTVCGEVQLAWEEWGVEWRHGDREAEMLADCKYPCGSVVAYATSFLRSICVRLCVGGGGGGVAGSSRRGEQRGNLPGGGPRGLCS